MKKHEVIELLTNTHISFAHIFYSYFNNKLNVRLDKRAFIYGNIYPDINPNKCTSDHTLKGSIGFILKYQDKLMNERISTEDYSTYLGIMCHFICDYFCLYHQESHRNRSTLEHFVYELKLDAVFTALLVSNKLYYERFIQYGNRDIISLILSMQNKYHKEKINFCRDIRYALATVLSVAELNVNLKTNRKIS